MLRIATAVSVALACCNLPAAAEEKPEIVEPLESLTPQEAADRIVAGIRRNHEALKTVHAKMQTVLETPSSDGVEHHQDIIKDGRIVGRATSRVPKRMVQKAEVWLTGQKLRFDVTTSGAPRKSWWRDAEIWTEYLPEQKWAAVRRTDQLPGMDTLDPRCFGTWGIRRDMVSLLEESKVRSVSWKSGSVLALEAVLPNGQRATLEFDRLQSFLPTRTALWNADGRAVGMNTMEYQAAPKDGPLFLKRATRIAFPPGGVETLPDKPVQWFQRTVTETSDVHVNQPLDESVFDVALPPGTEVRDSIQGKVYEQK